MDWDKYFTYNPETGKLYWKHRTDIRESRRKQWNVCNAGHEVGNISGCGRYLTTTLNRVLPD